MPTGIAITGAVNLLDGVHARVSVAGAASGPLEVVAAPVPDLSLATAVPIQAFGTAGEWRARLDHCGLWYLWGRDADGATDEPAPVWLGASDDPTLNLCGKRLEEVLLSNQAGIEAGLRADWYPDATVKHVAYGTAAAIRAFPAILVTAPREQAEYVAAPYVREHRFRFTVYTFILHNDSFTYMQAAARFAARVMEVLNKPEYQALRLADGTPLAFCEATEGVVDDVQVDENVWAALGTIEWSGSALKQGGAPVKEL